MVDKADKADKAEARGGLRVVFEGDTPAEAFQAAADYLVANPTNQLVSCAWTGSELRLRLRLID